MSKNKLAFGAVIGIAAGLVAGLLMAPKTGRHTRADLKLKAQELKNKAALRARTLKANSSKRKSN